MFIKYPGSAKWGRTQLLLSTRIKTKIVWMCWRRCINEVQLILVICSMVWSGRRDKLVEVHGARPVGSCDHWNGLHQKVPASTTGSCQEDLTQTPVKAIKIFSLL